MAQRKEMESAHEHSELFEILTAGKVPLIVASVVTTLATGPKGRGFKHGRGDG
jgi:hypothetical protein